MEVFKVLALMNSYLKTNHQAIIQPVVFDEIKDGQLFVLREDLIGAPVYGNKFRKLKYNVLEAQKTDKKTLLTFGGAYSNHIAAVAAMGNYCGLDTVGIIRGDELVNSWQENPTLQLASKNGMQFEFVSREQYRKKESAEFLEPLNQKYHSPFIIPEGGTNELAIKGCEEILTQAHSEFNIVCVAAGTGGTAAGLANSCLAHQKVMAFSSLKGDFLKKDIKKWAKNEQWSLTDLYSFGGYGKINQDLIAFINSFYQQTTIALDPLYTGKMIYGIIDLLKTNYFPEKTRILAVHTGGLQGIEGMNQKLAQKGWPLLSS